MQAVKRVAGTPARLAAAIAMSLAVSAGVFSVLGPSAYANPAKGGGTGKVEEVKAEPSALGISLQSEAASGANITVPDRTAVRADAQLTGVNAGTARGGVSYAVYSDSGCTNEVAWGGPRLIRNSSESAPVRLRPGTYYWQARYSGDAKDLPSVSSCGEAVETVEGADSPACTTAVGEANLGTEQGHLVVKNDLSTDLGAQQRLVVSWSGRGHLRLTKLLGVACVARPAGTRFHGVGEARLDGKSGYLVRFNIRVAKNGEESVHVRVRDTRREPVLDISGFPAAGSELIT